jgi:hypothetical protein
MKQLLSTPILGFSIQMSDEEYASHTFSTEDEYNSRCSRCGVKIYKSETIRKYFIRSKYSGLTCDEIIMKDVLE